MLRLTVAFTIALLASFGTAWSGNHEDSPDVFIERSVTLSELKARQVEGTTRAFIHALTVGDANALASTSDNQMRAKFPDPMSMLIGMRRAHNSLYKAKDYIFPTAITKNGIIAQQVYFSSAKGHRHKAVYLLRANESGQYLIFGCIIRQLPGKQI